MKSSDIYSKISIPEAYALIIAFVLFRLISIFGLYSFTGGAELASDTQFHEIIINDPLGILKGTAFRIASYPPFQWLVEWPLFNMYSMYFGEMVSYRLMMVTVEFIAFTVMIVVCRKIRLRKVIALSILVLFIVSPHQYIASIFFIQEDVIAQLFMLIAFLFLLYEKRGYCIASLVMGVLIAKLFFVVPLFYVILFQGRLMFRKRVVDGVLALLPLVVVYVFIITQALKHGGEVPIRDFTPDAFYAANYWVLLITSDPGLLVFYKNISLVFTTLVQFAVISAFLFFDRRKTDTWHPAILLVIPLAFFFGTFYQHMPEYLLMLWPVAALLCATVWQQLVLVAVMSFAWAPRVSHGLASVVEGYASTAEARSEIVGPFVNLVNIDFIILNQIMLVLQSIVYTIVVMWLCLLSRKQQQIQSND